MNKLVAVLVASVALWSACDAVGGVIGHGSHGRFGNADYYSGGSSNNAALKKGNTYGANNAIQAKKAFGSKQNAAAANKASFFKNRYGNTALAAHNNVLKDNQFAVSISSRNRFAKNNGVKFSNTHKSAAGARKSNKAVFDSDKFANNAAAAKKNAFVNNGLSGYRNNNAYANGYNRNLGLFNGGYGGYGGYGGIGGGYGGYGGLGGGYGGYGGLGGGYGGYGGFGKGGYGGYGGFGGFGKGGYGGFGGFGGYGGLGGFGGYGGFGASGGKFGIY